MTIRRKDDLLASQFKKKELVFDESTYHFSSQEKENDFIKLQFESPELYKTYQEYRYEWHRRSSEMEAGDYPLAVICELVSMCNLRCSMCYTVTPEFQDAIVGTQRMMPWETAINLIDECVELGVYSILFSWRGESTMYKAKDSNGTYHDIGDIFQYARDKGILEITCLSNGRILNDAMIEKIVKAQPNWISFSVDGLAEDYNKIRKSERKESSDPFESVITNIKKIVEVRDLSGLHRPQIRTNTIYPAIAKTPKKYKQYMENIGVGLVTINEMMDYRGATMPEDAIMDNWFCQYPFQRLVVSANGTIMPCPGSHNEEDDLALGRYIGCLPKKLFKDGKHIEIRYPEINLKQAWHSEKLKMIRTKHRNNLRKEIQACKHCRHGAKKFGVQWIPQDWDLDDMVWKGRVWRNY